MTNRIGYRTLVPAALATLATLTGCTTAAPVATPPAPPHSPSTSSTPSPPPAPSPSPILSSSSPSAPASPSRSGRPRTKKRPAHGCPVTADVLNRVPGVANGYRITPNTMRCWQDWATGWDPNQQGDGMYLFRYSQRSGWWVHGQGSAFNCARLGIPKDPDNLPPFCYYSD